MAETESRNDDPLVFHVSPRAVRRSRWFSYLLVFNWGFLGYLMYTFGSGNRGMFIACFVAGLLCFGTAVGQFRAIRLSQSHPLIRLADDRLFYRHYSSQVEKQVSFSEVAQLDTTIPKMLDFQLADEKSVMVRFAELTQEDGDGLVEELSSRLQRVKTD